MSDVLDHFSSRLDRAGVFLDFDGTLSDIVEAPSEARPIEGASDVLAELKNKLAVVAVVSGRSASQLLEWLGPAIEIWGVHGAERAVDGQVVVSERAAPYVALMRKVKNEVARRVRGRAFEGVTLEDKGVVIALHFRTASDPVAARRAVELLADELVDAYQLRIATGRMVLELRPPVDLSKATVVLDRARALSLEAALFVGDDAVDLSAFDALDQLSEAGCATVRVAVRSDEAPQLLLERADVIVDGPRGVLEFLEDLAIR